MRYLPKSPAERALMLSAIGVNSIDELFAPIPAEFRLTRDLAIPPQMAESEIVDWFRARAAENATGYDILLGAGAYHHYRPLVIDALISRGEWFTAYTPYQPEIAQGTLQAIFEFQTMICELTGMEVANASMYDGSTGAAEAVMMAIRITGRSSAILARSVHPEYREVIATYAKYQGLPLTERLHRQRTRRSRRPRRRHHPGDRLRPHPVAELLRHHRGRCRHRRGGPRQGCAARRLHCRSALARHRAPAHRGRYRLARNAVLRRSAQLRRPLCRSHRHPREVHPPDSRTPRRTDRRPQRQAWLRAHASTREQHIRREKATSNICTNQALIALMVNIYMDVYGRIGIRELAEQNLAKAAYARKALAQSQDSLRRRAALQ